MVKDLTTKRCLSDNDHYADLINGTMFGGRQLLRYMAYKAAEYDHQAEIIRRQVQKLPGITEEEFLSSFLKYSKLWPGVPLCCTLGSTGTAVVICTAFWT